MTNIEKKLIKMSKEYQDITDEEYRTEYFLNINPIVCINDEETPTMTLELWVDEWVYENDKVLRDGIIDTLELETLLTGDQVNNYDVDKIKYSYNDSIGNEFQDSINKWKIFIDTNKLTNVNLLVEKFTDIILCK